MAVSKESMTARVNELTEEMNNAIEQKEVISKYIEKQTE